MGAASGRVLQDFNSMNMPTKKYQVFVSSTFNDLKQERAEVIKALLEMDCFPCCMEFFPAANEDSWTYIERLIRECDYYIVIVAGKYGSLTNEGISYTEKEYQCAIDNGVPTLAFIHKEPENLPAKNNEQDAEKRNKLEKFTSTLQKKLCCMWQTQEDLYPKVVASMHKLIRSTPRVGWIPANSAGDPRNEIENLKQQARIKELEEKLVSKETISIVTDKNLSSGTDKFKAEVSYCKRGGIGFDNSNQIGTVVASWDEIFNAIAPNVINECSTEHLDKCLNDIYTEWFVRTQALTYGETLSDVKLTNISNGKIKVQLLALGLLQTNNASRNFKGQWRLSEEGMKKMIQLSAIRKNNVVNEADGHKGE